MNRAELAAVADLEATVDLCTDTGLVDCWTDLTREVYSRNLARFEPDELGDTAMSFGVQCAENLKTRAIRRFRHDDLEPPEHHWVVPDLTVTTLRNSLLFQLGGNRIFVMKVPFGEGRDPQWDAEKHWEQNSEIRHSVAEGNSRALGGFVTFSGGDDGLFPHPARPGRVRDFLLVWAGAPDTPLTAGWLTVPTMGDKPFVCVRPLWWDAEPAAQSEPNLQTPRGPSFDQRPSSIAEVIVKPRPADEAGSA